MAKKFTYLVYDGQYYKIGESVDPNKRLVGLRTANPSVSLVCYGDQVSEKKMHSIFSKKRVAGEWFNLNQQDVVKAIELIGGYFGREHIIPFGKYKGYVASAMTEPNQVRYMEWFVGKCKDKKNWTYKAFCSQLDKVRQKEKAERLRKEKTFRDELNEKGVIRKGSTTYISAEQHLKMLKMNR